MTIQTIGVGAVANDGTGDALRTAFIKANDNFAELDAGKANVASPALTGAPTAPTPSAVDNSTRIATMEAVQAALALYINAQDALVFKGGINCASNPNYTSAEAGWVIKVTGAGRIGGASGPRVEAGDTLICTVDNSPVGTHAAVGANWLIIQTNIDGAVVGPTSSVDGKIAVFSGTSGKVIADSGHAMPPGALIDDISAQTLTNKTLTAPAINSPTGIVKADVGLGNVQNWRSREILTAARTWYVRPDGSDSNNGLANNAGGAFLTVQKAVDSLCAVDMSIYQGSIQLADGTWNEAVQLKPYIGSVRPIIQGNNASRSNVVMNSASNAILNDGAGRWRVVDMKVIGTSTGLRAQNGGVIEFGNIDFGACGSHIFIDDGKIIAIAGSNYGISGAASYHFNVNKGSLSVSGARTITLTGTPAFTAFALLQNQSYGLLNGITFSGSATGKRHEIAAMTNVLTSGGGASFFPGNTAGTVDATSLLS